MKRVLMVVVLGSAVALAGCQSMGPKEQIGGLVGAGAGALAGSQFGSGKGRVAMAVIGALLGSQVGAGIGSSLDKVDRMEEQRTAARALESYPSGQTATWHNPDSGNGGTFTPVRTYRRADGQYCREFQQTITVGGQEERGYGTACRQPDGSWRIVS